MATHFDVVRQQLTVGDRGRVLRNGKPTAWTMVCLGRAKFRVVADDPSVMGDDRTSVSTDAELDRLAERIAADECDASKY